MSLPQPPYVVKSVDSTPEQDAHGNTGAFITLTNGQSALLRMKGVFPLPGDEISDRVLVEKTSQSGNTYLKLEKPQRNGSSGGSKTASQDGPDEAYWAGQNAAKGRAHAQAVAVQAWVAGFRTASGQEGPDVAVLTPLIDHFERDVHAARDRAVESAGRPSAPPGGESGAASPGPGPHTRPAGHDSLGNGGAPTEQPTQVVTASDDSPTQKQTDYMIDLAKKQGLDGPAMRAVLKTRLGVEQFSQLRKADCVDKFKAALAEPFLEESPKSDIPDWPPEELPPPSSADQDSVPF